MNARAHFSKARHQAKQIRVTLDKYEQLIDDMESLLKTLPKSVNVLCNSTETACLSVALRVNSSQVYFTIHIDGLGDTLARNPQTKITLHRIKRNGDLDDGVNILPGKLRHSFRQVRNELLS